MPEISHASPTAVAYARSLLELADESGQAEAIGQELRDVRSVIEGNPIFGEFLRDPGISREERTAVLDKTFAGRTSPLLWNFLRLLNEKGRLGLLLNIDDAYDELLEELLGKIEVDVTVAQRLDDEQFMRVQQSVADALGKQVVLHQYVDESIIGGLILRVQDRVIDGSVQQQLRTLREQFLSARRQAARTPHA